MKDLWIIGSGGHAKVVIDAARATGNFNVCGCLDDDASALGKKVLGVSVRGTTDAQTLNRLEVELAIIAIGDNRIRKTIAERLGERIAWATIIHPHSYIASSSGIGRGTLIMAGAIIQPGCTIGEHVIINTSSSLDHDCVIGSYCHIAPGTHLAGNVTLQEGVMLGVGTSVIPGVIIGRSTTVGAGAAVIEDLPSNIVAVGVPARVIKEHRIS